MKSAYLIVLCLAGMAGHPAWAAPVRPVETQLNPEQLYKDYCSICHGDRGDGSSRASNSLVPPPRNFTMAYELTREVMIATVTNGKPGTAMAAWKSRLNPQQVELVVDYVRTKFIQPTIDARMNYGRMAYLHNCKSCHGEKGEGLAGAGMAKPPRSFASPDARKIFSREHMISAVNQGVPGTLMRGYSDKLAKEQVEAVVDYVRNALMPEPAPAPAADAQEISGVDMNLPMPMELTGDMRKGERFFLDNCATCHGKSGDGQGPRAYFMTIKPRNFVGDSARATLNRPAIFAAAKFGKLGTEMPAWGQVLSDQEIANVSEFVFRTFIQTNPGSGSGNSTAR